MDLGTITQKVIDNAYAHELTDDGELSCHVFEEEVQLVFNNCMTYNTDEMVIYHNAKALLKLFNQMYRVQMKSGFSQSTNSSSSRKSNVSESVNNVDVDAEAQEEEEGVQMEEEKDTIDDDDDDEEEGEDYEESDNDEDGEDDEEEEDSDSYSEDYGNDEDRIRRT